MNSREVGRKGEDIACRYLLNEGYRIIQRNWFCYAGELDVICRDSDNSLALIEVKFSQNNENILPEEMFTEKKKRKLKRTIGIYISIHNFIEYRIDLI